MSLKSSWGLIFDLDTPSDEHIRALYEHIWDQLQGPETTMGKFKGIARAAEGRLKGFSAKCYTKFEYDRLGYPPGWEVPLSFQLAVYELEQPLDQDTKAREHLRQLAHSSLEIIPYRMAVIGDLGMYYCNADMLTPDWLDLHQESLLELILTHQHPLTRQQPGADFGASHSHYKQHELKPFWTTDDSHSRYLRYKQKLSQQMHSQSLQLEWENTATNSDTDAN